MTPLRPEPPPETPRGFSSHAGPGVLTRCPLWCLVGAWASKKKFVGNSFPGPRGGMGATKNSFVVPFFEPHAPSAKGQGPEPRARGPSSEPRPGALCRDPGPGARCPGPGPGAAGPGPAPGEPSPKAQGDYIGLALSIKGAASATFPSMNLPGNCVAQPRARDPARSPGPGPEAPSPRPRSHFVSSPGKAALCL